MPAPSFMESDDISDGSLTVCFPSVTAFQFLCYIVHDSCFQLWLVLILLKFSSLLQCTLDKMHTSKSTARIKSVDLVFPDYLVF